MTAEYNAPEVIREQYPTLKVDVWAAGIILYKLCTFRHPFLSENNDLFRTAMKISNPSGKPDL
jgi:serine/threonine protein kinase